LEARDRDSRDIRDSHSLDNEEVIEAEEARSKVVLLFFGLLTHLHCLTHLTSFFEYAVLSSMVIVKV
jgi:hypothetical protein